MSEWSVRITHTTRQPRFAGWGKSSLTHSPDWPQRWNSNGEPNSGSVLAANLSAVTVRPSCSRNFWLGVESVEMRKSTGQKNEQQLAAPARSPWAAASRRIPPAQGAATRATQDRVLRPAPRHRGAEEFASGDMQPRAKCIINRFGRFRRSIEIHKLVRGQQDSGKTRPSCLFHVVVRFAAGRGGCDITAPR